jgi:undecaprenyl-diphosphatase
MSTFWSVIILAVIQGATEFLPVSSSGHLVLGGRLAGLPPAEGTLEVVLHLGTLAAVLLFFRRRLGRLLADAAAGRGEGRRWLLALVLGSIPAGLAGVLLKDFFEAQFTNLVGTGCWLLVTGLGLALFGCPPRHPRRGAPRAGQALLVGLAQALAILPGISRSGATIVAGMRAGLDRRRAGALSFFLAIPAILGAGALKVGELGGTPYPLAHLAAGALVSALVGLLCLWILMWLLEAGRLRLFAPWCLAAGTAAIVLGLAG